jgi:hypothetical protein
MNQDLEHLRLLSIFHYVLAGMVALFSLFPVFHLVLGIAMLTGRLPNQQGDHTAEVIAGSLFVAFAASWMVCGFTIAVCLALAGRFLAQRRRYLFCLVMAGVSCMFAPVGTLLGVFTFLVLLRPSVKELFGESSQPAAAPADPRTR